MIPFDNGFLTHFLSFLIFALWLSDTLLGVLLVWLVFFFNKSIKW